MSYAPPLDCRRCGAAVPRDGGRAYRCPSCGDRVIIEGVSLDA